MTRKIEILLLLLFFSGMLSSAQEKNLDYYLTQGIIHSPVLKDLNNQISSGSVDSLLITAGHKPQVSYNGLAYYAPVINGVGYSEVITNISNITSVVYVSQRIFYQKLLDAQYSRIGIQNQTFRTTSKITEIELKKAITLQYLAACSVFNDIVFNGDLIKSSRDEEPVLKQLVEKGMYRQVDYNSFMVELASLDILYKDSQIQYRKELAALNLLCGLPDSAFTELQLPVIQLKAPVNLMSSVFFNRFLNDSMKIQNEKSLIDYNYKPAINWFSDAGLINNIPREITRNFGFSAGLSLTVPIYDGKQRKLNYDKLKLAENTRLNYADYFKQQYNQQLRQLYSELDDTRNILPVASNQLSLAESVINQDKSLLNAGNISVTDYVTALKNYISIKHNYNQFQIRILQIMTEINYWNQ